MAKGSLPTRLERLFCQAWGIFLPGEAPTMGFMRLKGGAMDFQRSSRSLRSRLHLGEVTRPAAIGLAAVLVGALGAAGWALAQAPSEASFEVQHGQEAGQGVADAPEPPAQLAVYVSGEVGHPSLCYLDEGSRVADAIEAAGGFTDEADASALNLARVLSDGEQVDVPALQEATTVTAPSGSSSQAAASGRVNINTADAAALESLSGIGQATAAKIIADREANGPFKTIDDLKRVSGIGDKKLEGLRQDICV